MSTELSLAASANRGERITSGAHTCSLARTGCTKFWMRLRPLLSVQLRHTLKQSSSRALPCTAACERRRTAAYKSRARPERSHLSRQDVQHVALSTRRPTRRTLGQRRAGGTTTEAPTRRSRARAVGNLQTSCRSARVGKRDRSAARRNREITRRRPSLHRADTVTGTLSRRLRVGIVPISGKTRVDDGSPRLIFESDDVVSAVNFWATRASCASRSW